MPVQVQRVLVDVVVEEKRPGLGAADRRVTRERDITLITRDFTKLFITPEAYVEFTRRGGRLLVLQRSRLIAVTLNPTSPQGFLLDSKSTCEAMSDALQTPVYDVMKIEI